MIFLIFAAAVALVFTARCVALRVIKKLNARRRMITNHLRIMSEYLLTDRSKDTNGISTVIMFDGWDLLTALGATNYTEKPLEVRNAIEEQMIREIQVRDIAEMQAIETRLAGLGWII